MAIKPFQYTPEQWSLIAKHLKPGDDAAAALKSLEAAGLRYQLEVRASGDSERHLRQKPRQALVKRLKRIIRDLEQLSEDQRHGLLQPLAVIKARIESDELRLVYKRAKAEKPSKNALVTRVLDVWRVKLGRKVPKGGGNPDGPLARFLIDAANPILQTTDDVIGSGDNARKLIKKVENQKA